MRGRPSVTMSPTIETPSPDLTGAGTDASFDDHFLCAERRRQRHADFGGAPETFTIEGEDAIEGATTVGFIGEGLRDQSAD